MKDYRTFWYWVSINFSCVGILSHRYGYLIDHLRSSIGLFMFRKEQGIKWFWSQNFKYPYDLLEKNQLYGKTL
jgi:hypothetical protein